MSNFKSNATHYTTTEAGTWQPWPPSLSDPIHSIKFENGESWDRINGWRPKMKRLLKPSEETIRDVLKVLGNLIESARARGPKNFHTESDMDRLHDELSTYLKGLES